MKKTSSKQQNHVTKVMYIISYCALHAWLEKKGANLITSIVVNEN